MTDRDRAADLRRRQRRRAVRDHIRLAPLPHQSPNPRFSGGSTHVRHIFGDRIDFEFDYLGIPRQIDLDLDTAVDRFLEPFPPFVTARTLLEPQGAWAAAEAALRPAIAKIYTDPPTYLVASGTRRG